MTLSAGKPEYLTIVTGLPRSGTSMLMQMLAAGGMTPCSDGLRTADESNPQGYWEHDRVKRLATDAAWLLDVEGDAIKIVAPLLRFLPAPLACRVIWIDRDLDEVLASQQKMIALAGARGADLPADRLKQAVTQQLEGARAWLAARPATPVLTLAHRQVIDDPAAAAEQIERFLGLGLDSTAMAAAVSPELYRNRR